MPAPPQHDRAVDRPDPAERSINLIRHLLRLPQRITEIVQGPELRGVGQQRGKEWRQVARDHDVKVDIQIIAGEQARLEQPHLLPPTGQVTHQRIALHAVDRLFGHAHELMGRKMARAHGLELKHVIIVVFVAPLHADHSELV